MRGMTLPCIAGLLAASPSTAAQNAWSADTQLSAPIVRYDGENFGVIIGCDNSATFTIITISDLGAFNDLPGRDQQLVLMVDGEEVARRAAWREDKVAGLASFESYLPSRHMPALRAAKDEVVLTIGDPFSGASVSFTAKPDDLSTSTSKLVEHCSHLG